MKFRLGNPAAMAETPSEVLNWRLYWSTFVFGKLFICLVTCLPHEPQY
jgi:hypothetical protein